MQRIQTNKDIKWHLSNSLINHSMMVAEFKSKQPISDEQLAVNVPHQDSAILSQTEIHMKTIMGSYFRPDDMKFNIRSMLRIKNASSNIDIARGQQSVDDDKLVTQLLTLIQREKSTSNTLFLYHGCNSTVAFIYYVNTLFYQLLDINNNKTTFRMDVDSFDNYGSIANFIEIYSQSVSRINDHDDGYSEVALCANTFLFGSQQDFAEGSLQFFMDNIAIKTIDLQNLFYNLFLPLGINIADIDCLISLFDDFNRFHGSALYQIQVPKEAVAQYVYPSVKLGSVYNPHQHQDLYESMNAYRAYYEDKDAGNCSSMKGGMGKFLFDAKYILNLQARLYASPNANFISHIVSYADISQNSLVLANGMNEVKAKIRSCVIGMLNSILSSNKKRF